MVTYLRNNQAVSWLGLEPGMQKSKVDRPNHYTTEPVALTWFPCIYISDLFYFNNSFFALETIFCNLQEYNCACKTSFLYDMQQLLYLQPTWAMCWCVCSIGFKPYLLKMTQPWCLSDLHVYAKSSPLKAAVLENSAVEKHRQPAADIRGCRSSSSTAWCCWCRQLSATACCLWLQCGHGTVCQHRPGPPRLAWNQGLSFLPVIRLTEVYHCPSSRWRAKLVFLMCLTCVRYPHNILWLESPKSWHL